MRHFRLLNQNNTQKGNRRVNGDSLFVMAAILLKCILELAQHIDVP